MKYSAIREALKKESVYADNISYEDGQVVLEFGKTYQLEDYLEAIEVVVENLDLDYNVTETTEKATVTLFQN